MLVAAALTLQTVAFVLNDAASSARLDATSKRAPERTTNKLAQALLPHNLQRRKRARTLTHHVQQRPSDRLEELNTLAELRGLLENEQFANDLHKYFTYDDYQVVGADEDSLYDTGTDVFNNQNSDYDDTYDISDIANSNFDDDTFYAVDAPELPQQPSSLQVPSNEELSDILDQDDEPPDENNDAHLRTNQELADIFNDQAGM